MSDTEQTGSGADATPVASAAPEPVPHGDERPAGAVPKKQFSGLPVRTLGASTAFGSPRVEFQRYVTARRGTSAPPVYDMDAQHWSLGGARRSVDVETGPAHEIAQLRT